MRPMSQLQVDLFYRLHHQQEMSGNIMTIDTMLKAVKPLDREPDVLDAPRPVEDETLLQFMDRVDTVLREMDRLLGAYNREVGLLRQTIDNEHQNTMQMIRRIAALEEIIAKNEGHLY